MKSVKAVIGVGLAILGFCLAVWAVANVPRIMDQVAVWTYTPSDTIARYADATTMTDDGKHLFYASRPEILDQAEFDRQCEIEDDVSAIGCYRPDFLTIFIVDLPAEFDDVEETTAAHELLHAVWDRMNTDERRAMTVLIEAEAERLATDERFVWALSAYDGVPDVSMPNELHSILGSEFSDLSPELEAHYALYFADRDALVALTEPFGPE